MPRETTRWIAMPGSLPDFVCDWCAVPGEWQRLQQGSHMESLLTRQVNRPLQSQTVWPFRHFYSHCHSPIPKNNSLQHSEGKCKGSVEYRCFPVEGMPLHHRLPSRHFGRFFSNVWPPFKSSWPEISRIPRQKRNFIFHFISPKIPLW